MPKQQAVAIPGHRPVEKQRTDWNEENIKRVTDVLSTAGYKPGALYQGTVGIETATIEFWLGPGANSIIALQRYNDEMGFDLLIPLESSNNMDVVIEKLKEACKRVFAV